MCQTVSCVTRNEWDVFYNDSLAEAADADGPNMDEFYQRVVSSDDEDFVDSDDGSVMDLNRDMSEEEEFINSDDGSIADLDRAPRNRLFLNTTAGRISAASGGNAPTAP